MALAALGARCFMFTEPEPPGEAGCKPFDDVRERGHRPAIDQHIRLAADGSGKLTAIQHDYVNHTSLQDDYDEGCGEATGFLYSCPNVLVTGSLARRNVGTPTSMRGPGAVPGLYAVESAMDELAIKFKMDRFSFG